MNENKAIYDEISELFNKKRVSYRAYISPILGTMSKFLFSSAPAAEKNIVGLIKDDILVFEDMLAGYIYSFLDSEKIPNNYSTYLRKHKFYSEDQIQKLTGILSEGQKIALSEYLKDMDRMKQLFESLL